MYSIANPFGAYSPVTTIAFVTTYMRGPGIMPWLMASLMYGGGLRLLECAELRVKD